MRTDQGKADSLRQARVSPLRNYNFRLLWLGENVSLLGDQFYIVALPWLVFQMTGSSLAFGAILMAAGVPRAVFLLIGGVMTDRFSPQAIMTTSNLLRLFITLILTLLIAAQAVQLWMLFVIAVCFGVVDAFFHPAYRAIIPYIVDEEDLQVSNSLMQTGMQLVKIGGPSIAGLAVESVGLVLSFAFDAFTFLFTSIMLLLMHPITPPQNMERLLPVPKRRSILAEIRDMIAFVSHDPLLQTIVPVIGAINLLFTGPMIVGSAALAKVHFIESGSIAFGAMLSAFSIGMLLGTLVASFVHSKHAGLISLLLVAAQGILMIGVAFAPTLLIACGLWMLVGCGAGFGNITVITLTQRHVSKDMMGRVMSLIVLAEIGLAPISNALAGFIADISVTGLLVIAGALLTLTALLAARNPTIRAGED